MTLLICKEKTRRFIAFLIAGMASCLAIVFWHKFAQNVTGYSGRYYTCNFAPFFEELFKLLPILIYAFIAKPKRQTLLECAVAVGVGFSIVENAGYLVFRKETYSIVLAVIRGFSTGVMHGTTTLLEGIMLSFVRTRRKLFYTGTAALFIAAVTYHSLFNQIVTSKYELIAYIMPAVTIIPLAIVLGRKKMLE